jgi:ribosomal protein S18 acetylase RimI-like enzyme
MRIEPSTVSDLETILAFYDKAIDFQKTVSDQHWLPFEKELIVREISEKKQWKLVVDQSIVGVFAITFSDPNIWGDKNKDAAIYIHRIVTDPGFRGNNLVGRIVQWAKVYGRDNGKDYVRMDTWADNLKLRAHYEKFGFTYLGVVTPQNLNELPAHYSAITLSLFEMPVK